MQQLTGTSPYCCNPARPITTAPFVNKPRRCYRHCHATAGNEGPVDTSKQASQPGPSLTDPVQTIAWGGRLPSPRRLVLSGLTATGVVLGGNLGGITSKLLGIDQGRLAQRLQLDALFPVDAQPVPYKRCIDGTYGYEYIYPADWLADQTLAARAARRAELARGLDPPPLTPRSGAIQRSSVFEPVSAYGPAGSTGEENMSVIVAPIEPGYTLESMGSPERVATQFLDMIVPPSSHLTATLLQCGSRSDSNGQLYYTMEYTVRGPKFYRHNLSVITARGNQLYTFNAQTPETKWREDAAALQASADSFRLATSRLDSTGFPVRQ